MISPPNPPDAAKSLPAQGDFLNETPPIDPLIAEEAFATHSKSAKSQTGKANGKHWMSPPATLVPALRSHPLDLSGAFRQKRIAGTTGMTIGLSLAYFLAVPAYSSVTITSEQYHCFGYGSDVLIPLYNNSDSSPVSGSDGWSAQSSAWKFGAFASTAGSSGRAGASSTFVFTVDKPILIIQFTGSLWARARADTEGGISYSLTETLTSNNIAKNWILTTADSQEQGYTRDITESITHNLTPGNEYTLLISANVTNADGSDAFLSAVLIPEPTSFLLLSFGGVGGLLLRNRTQNQAST